MECCASFVCKYCSSTFEKYYHLKIHRPQCGYNRHKFVCHVSGCLQRFYREKLLIEHLALMHGIENELPKKEKGRKRCYFPNCEELFPREVHLWRHLKVVHNVNVKVSTIHFPNEKQFLSWKNGTEAGNNISFRSRGGRNAKGSVYGLYTCVHDDLKWFKNRNKSNRTNKKGKLLGTGTRCPSRIYTYKKEGSDSILVKYVETHSHPTDFSNTQLYRLNASDMNKIKECLSVGISCQKIRKIMTTDLNTICKRNNKKMGKRHFYSLKNIQTLEKRLFKNSYLRKDDTSLILQEKGPLEKKSIKPTSLYKPLEDKNIIINEVNQPDLSTLKYNEPHKAGRCIKDDVSSTLQDRGPLEKKSINTTNLYKPLEGKNVMNVVNQPDLSIPKYVDWHKAGRCIKDDVSSTLQERGSLEKKSIKTTRLCKPLEGKNVMNEVNQPDLSVPKYVDRHKAGNCIKDEDVLFTQDVTKWKVKSQSSDSWHLVIKLQNSCKYDHCYTRCAYAECNDLCEHIYQCNCCDQSKLCKHIHKIAMLDYFKQTSASQSQNLISFKPIDENKTNKSAEKFDQFLHLSHELESRVTTSENIQNTMLDYFISTINQAINLCKDIDQKCLSNKSDQKSLSNKSDQKSLSNKSELLLHKNSSNISEKNVQTFRIVKTMNTSQSDNQNYRFMMKDYLSAANKYAQNQNELHKERNAVVLEMDVTKNA